MKTWRLNSWPVLALVLVLAGCGDRASGPVDQQEKPHNVRALVLGPRSGITRFIEVSGPVVPVRGTNLAAEEAGAVVEITRDKGDAVQEGDILLAQDRTLLAAELEAAKSALETSAFNLDKMRKLFDAGKISRLELLQSEDAHAQADARARTARRRYDRAAVTAPFAGVVVDRFVELGQYLLPGQETVRVIDTHILKLTGYLTADQVGRVGLGTRCEVVCGDGQPATDGTVRFISREADLKTGKFKLEVEIPNPDGDLLSGVIGRARIPGDRVQGMVIPRDVVLTGLTGSTVFVARGGRAVRRPVALGQGQGLMVSVEEGLAPGDTLIVRGQRALRDGNRIAITEWSDAPDGSLPSDPGVVHGGTADPASGARDGRTQP